MARGGSQEKRNLLTAESAENAENKSPSNHIGAPSAKTARPGDDQPPLEPTNQAPVGLLAATDPDVIIYMISYTCCGNSLFFGMLRANSGSNPSVRC